jgi:hypothetical protein
MTAEFGHAPNRIYVSQAGDLHQNGGHLYDTAETNLTATFSELNAVAGGQVGSVTFSPAAGSANVCIVTVQALDGTGAAITYPIDMDLLLSDAASGAGLTATTASGAVANSGTAGADIGTLTSKKALRVQTDATGKYTLSITDTAKTGFYVVACLGSRKPFVSAQLITANYG